MKNPYVTSAFPLYQQHLAAMILLAPQTSGPIPRGCCSIYYKNLTVACYSRDRQCLLSMIMQHIHLSCCQHLKIDTCINQQNVFPSFQSNRERHILASRLSATCSGMNLYFSPQIFFASLKVFRNSSFKVSAR